jgi:hypothetical protein
VGYTDHRQSGIIQKLVAATVGADEGTTISLHGPHRTFASDVNFDAAAIFSDHVEVLHWTETRQFKDSRHPLCWQIAMMAADSFTRLLSR